MPFQSRSSRRRNLQFRKMPQTILYRESVPTDTSALKGLRAVVEREALGAGFPAEVACQIVVAVDEACTNVIEHSFRNLPSGHFTIEIGADGDQFIVTLTDSGRPFNGHLPRHLDLSELVASGSSGGLGLHIIGRVMDIVDYSSGTSDRNVLRLVKRLP